MTLLEQVVRTVERDERADLLVAEAVLGVDDELLGELDDRAVRSAEHRRRAALSAPRRHRVDEQLHLIGHKRIEADELVFGGSAARVGDSRRTLASSLLRCAATWAADARPARRRSCPARAGW